MARTQQRSICSFCGKRQDQAQRVIAGPGGVYICDACVDLCAEIIQEEGAVTHRTDEGALARRRDPQARLWRASERHPRRFASGERVFDALLTLGYCIDI